MNRHTLLFALLMIAGLFFTLNVDAKVECSDTCKKVLETVTEEQKSCVLEAHAPKVVKAKAVVKTVVVEKIVEKVVEKRVEVVKEAPTKRNRISVFGISSQSGMDVSNNGTNVDVEAKRKLGVGLMYQRVISNDISLGIGASTNRDVMGSVGLDF